MSKVLDHWSRTSNFAGRDVQFNNVLLRVLMRSKYTYETKFNEPLLDELLQSMLESTDPKQRANTET